MNHSSDDVAPSVLRVRPYTVTRGRTDTDVELTIETMIRLTSPGAGHGITSSELAQIASLCAEPQSIAELSAHLHLPLQVVKILVGDLVTSGVVTTHKGSEQGDGRPDLALLERVLDGLQSL